MSIVSTGAPDSNREFNSTAPAHILNAFGADLTEVDYQRLAARWITPELAAAAGLRRVDSYIGREMFARKTGDCAGIIIPYVQPGSNHIEEYRLRVDNPELERRSDGSVRETRKYLQPPGRRNRVYFPPGLPPALLDDPSVLVIITEGEFKAVALWRLATYQTTTPRFIVCSVSGVENWRGSIGKAEGPNGERRDVKGVLPELERIACKGRRFVVAYDADAETNPNVRGARARLMVALTERSTTVGFLEWPIAEGKGIDDRIANVGPEKVLADLERIEFGGWNSRLLRNDKGKLMSCYENVALFLQHSPDWSGVLGFNEFTGGARCFEIPAPPNYRGARDRIGGSL
jgi:hypothetical protein